MLSSTPGGPDKTPIEVTARATLRSNYLLVIRKEEQIMGAAVGTAIADGVAQAQGVITANMPIVFGVAVAFVAWNVGRRVLGKI